MHELSTLLPHGAARRDEVTLATSSSSVTRWSADGDLVLPHPGVVALPGRAQEWEVRARAATLWARGPLSHQSALVQLGLLPCDTGPIHVTVPADRWPRGSDGVLAHRTTLPMSVHTTSQVRVHPLATVDDRYRAPGAPDRPRPTQSRSEPARPTRSPFWAWRAAWSTPGRGPARRDSTRRPPTTWPWPGTH